MAEQENWVSDETTELRWFDEHGLCRMCRKQSAGILRGTQNQSYGEHCRKCADNRLKASKREREKRGVR